MTEENNNVDENKQTKETTIWTKTNKLRYRWTDGRTVTTHQTDGKKPRKPHEKNGARLLFKLSPNLKKRKIFTKMEN